MYEEKHIWQAMQFSGVLCILEEVRGKLQSVFFLFCFLGVRGPTAEKYIDVFANDC